MRPRILWWLAVPMMALLASPSQAAQAGFTGSIVGTVIDATHAAIPEADVIVTNVGTNQSVAVRTDRSGTYLVPNLQPGTYSLEVSATGFKHMVRSGITLQIDQRARVDLTLETGGVAETIDVRGDAPLLQTESSSLGQVIDNRSIVTMPLAGRGAFSLVSLVPGVTDGSASARGASSRISGGRNRLNEIQLDGVTAVNVGNGNVGYTPMIDALQEFKILTNSFSAEFGRTGGGIIVATIKSGTNRLRGTAFEFHRNDAFNARNFFARPQDPNPVLRFNQFGLAAGGPLRKDKTFFFADWQGTRNRTASTRVSTVPTEAMRRGDLSGLGTVFDPQTAAADGSRTPFPGNIVPSGRTDPAAVKILEYYPLPNLPGRTNNYVLSGPGRSRGDQGDIRVDHALSSRDRVMLRYSVSDSNGEPSPNFPTLGNPDNYASTGRQQNAVVSHSHTFGTAAINELRFGFNHIQSATEAPTEGMDFPSTLGVPNVPPDVFPRINITGLTSIGTNRSTPNSSLATSIQIVDNFTEIRGRHLFKAGFDFRHSTYQPYSPTNASGEFSFTSTQTANLAGGRTSGGDAFGSFLLGLGSGFQFLPGLRSVLSVPTYDAYVQDDFKVTSRLTVNAGLRWEPGFHFTEKENRISSFNPQAVCAAQSPLMRNTSADMNCGRFAAGVVTLIRAGVDGAPRHFYRTDWNNLGPRIGLAFSPDVSTVLRAGYGVYYSTPATASNPGTPLEAAFPWARSFSVPPATRLGDPLFVLSRFPGGASDFDTTGRTAGEIVWFDPESVTPRMESWNVAVQRELNHGFSGEVAYAGSRGTHLYSPGTNLNQIPPELLGPPEQFGGATPQARRPFPEFNNIALNTFGSSSIYHALQVKMQKRASSGLSVLLAYTFSQSIDDGSGLFPGDNPNTGSSGAFRRQNRYDQEGERSISADDQTHRLTVSYSYDFPFGRGRRWPSDGVLGALLGGWQTSGIFIARSGLPFGVHVEANTSQSLGGRLRANRVCDGELPRAERSIQRWFNTSCFVAPPPFTFGNSARNVLRAPALVNLDAMLARRVAVGRQSELELRIEAFNVFNRPQFGLPIAAVDDPRFGSISTTAGDNRTLQVGVKLYFGSEK
jgi:hypothetical protein